MGRRLFLFLAAMFMALLAEGFWTGHASRAADDCMTKPGAAAPQGSHWYYHLDRTNNRQCWYLAAEGAKVRPHARHAASPVRSQSPKPVARLEESAAAVQFAGTPAQAIPAEAAPADMTVGRDGADENDAAPPPPKEPPKNWASLPASAVSNDRDAVVHGFAGNQPDARPSISPVISPAEPRVIELPDEPAAAHGSTFLFAVAGFAAMIAGAALAAFTLRKPSLSHAKRRSASRSSPQRPAKQAFPEVARVVVPAGQTEMSRKKVPSPPMSSVDDIELRVRRLLHELQRREHERCDRDRTLGKLAAGKLTA